MARPTRRTLAVLELLQSHGQLSGAELAGRLGIDRRTVRRTLSRLEELGIPITTERGRHGGYGLVAGFKLPPMLFTEEEALALAVGLLAASGLGLGAAGPAVASARAKLERVLPGLLRERARAITETVALELAPPEPPADSAWLPLLAEAARSGRRVRLEYRSARGEATGRDFDPYGLAYRAGRWYLLGHCQLRGGQRTLRLDRIARAEPLEARFTRPAHFDALAELSKAVATLPRAIAVEVLLAAGPERARAALGDCLGVYEATAGGTLLRSQTDDLPWFARQLARLPFPFEIHRPEELRRILAEHARSLLRSLEPGRDVIGLAPTPLQPESGGPGDARQIEPAKESPAAARGAGPGGSPRGRERATPRRGRAPRARPAG
ncbi:MAG: YafY family protein [Thermoanaerobaculia bacterium]